MGFFKDFKDDFSQAVNELLPGDDFSEADEIQVNTLDGELDVEQELSKLDGLLEQVEKKASRATPAASVQKAEEKPMEAARQKTEPKAKAEAEPVPEELPELELAPLEKPAEEPKVKPEPKAAVEPKVAVEPKTVVEPEAAVLPVQKAEPAPAPKLNAEVHDEPVAQKTAPTGVAAAPRAVKKPAASVTQTLNTNMSETIKEEKSMDTMDTTVTATTVETPAEPVAAPAEPVEVKQEVTDEVSLITAGTSIKGNMETTGSFEIEGKIEGDIKCNGKLTVIGTVLGNSASSEFFADAAHIEGEVVSSGTVKIGLGSVIIGNITATSAVVAGAVKGDIDVQGPVVVDTSAVIMGNIKSRSVQINNGAVIEGFCSQCYSDVDVESLFSKNK